MKEEKRILLVGSIGSGKTTLINALIGKKVLSVAHDTREITCIYNEEAYTKHPIIDNCNQYIGVSFDHDLREKQICFIDTPGWGNIHILERLIKSNQIDTILFVISVLHFVDSQYNGDLVKLISAFSGIKLFFCLTRCDSLDIEDDDIVQTVNCCKSILQEMLKQHQIHNPTILTVSPLNALLVKRRNNGESRLIDLDLKYVMMMNDYPELHLNNYCDNNIECQDDELLKHTGILNLEALLYEEC